MIRVMTRGVGSVISQRRLGFALTAVMVAVMVVAGALVDGVRAAPEATDASVAQDLARVRQATKQFHSVEAAEAAGYVGAGEPCVEVPGLGAMGIHYVKHSLVMDPGIDLERPEVLLYIPTPSGLRLVGVEYFKVDSDQDLATDADRPSLFGRGFDGPMEGHGPGMPIHYDLHVWVWQANPAGIFAEFNPNLACS